MTRQLQQFVDVVPFAARQMWVTPQDYEVWWEDPRDIYQVVVQFAVEPVSVPQPFYLDYWCNSWPQVRVAKGAVVGAGESGWLANDDWTNGDWQPADCQVKQEGKMWVCTFHPLNSREFPEEQDFPASFRRTLKLRLRFQSTPVGIEKLSAFTDSVWREADLAIEWKSPSGKAMLWDGTLEAFNAEIQQVKSLDPATTVFEKAGWHSKVAGADIGSILARVRYAFNEDRNSFDRAIVTFRSAGCGGNLPGFSFFVEDALQEDPIYLRDLGVLIRQVGEGPAFSVFEKAWEKQHTPTLYQRITDLPEQTWEQSWAHMPRKTSRMYYTLGCEGSRQKFGVEPEGDVFLWENYIRRAPGRDTPRLGWEGGELRFKFGFPAVEPGYRAILEDYLPVIRTVWVVDGVSYEQEAFATWLLADMLTEWVAGDDPAILMMQVRIHNLSDQPRTIAFPVKSIINGQTVETLSVRGGLVVTDKGRLRLLIDPGSKASIRSQSDRVIYKVRLPVGGSHTFFIKIPHLDLVDAGEISCLRSLDYLAEKERVVAYWRRRIAAGTQIQTPNETINNFYRTHLMHMLVINDREPGADRNVARCGGFHYGSFPDEGCMAISDLDRRGYNQEAERCLELYVHYQGTASLPGNFRSAEGVFYGSGGYEVAGYNRNHGWVLWCLAEHYRYTRDRAWLERVAPALVKGCDWIIRERQATMQKGTIQYGFLPSGSLEDVTDYWTWLATNAYACWGFNAAVEVLSEISHPELGRLRQEALAFTQDLKAGFFEACARSPVVRLRDGTWVPHFPARQERRGRDFGWLREVLEGACHLIYCGLVAPDEPAARWIIEDFEDNLFLSEQYGYQAADFERQWFHLGGFSNQSNLLLFPPLYLWRDEPKHFLRGYFNAFTSAFFPDTMTMCEHALPDLEHWRGDHFKSSDEANSNSWLRLMFLAEYGEELFIGQAIPRAWFEHGKTMQVKRAMTHFGETSLELISQVATGAILVRLDPPRRNPPKRIRLRVRHPEGLPIRAVWVNGLPHHNFDSTKEVVVLEQWIAPVEVRFEF